MHLSLNARFRTRPVTGVERFASEVTKRLVSIADVDIHEILPGSSLAGLKGHAWEQFVLPRKVDRDTVLFSPCNTGPISVHRQLVVIHDAAVWDCPDAFSRSFRTLYQNLLPALAKRAAGIATVSEFSRLRLAKHLNISPEKIHVLGNASGPSFSLGSSEGVSEGVSEGSSEGSGRRDDPNSGPTLLCVGSLDPRKNIGRLIEAWIELSRSGRIPEGARLEIVGSAKPSNFSHFEMVDVPGIHWIGRVNDQELVQRYRNADAFVFPSLYEGFGLPPLEAMASGCPVLLSSEASLPEVGGPAFDPADLDSAGAATYFDPRSVSEMASAIESMLNLDAAKRKRLTENALAHASKFSWGKVAERTFLALESL